MKNKETTSLRSSWAVAVAVKQNHMQELEDLLDDDDDMKDMYLGRREEQRLATTTASIVSSDEDEDAEAPEGAQEQPPRTRSQQWQDHFPGVFPALDSCSMLPALRPCAPTSRLVVCSPCQTTVQLMPDGHGTLHSRMAHASLSRHPGRRPGHSSVPQLPMGGSDPSCLQAGILAAAMCVPSWWPQPCCQDMSHVQETQ